MYLSMQIFRYSPAEQTLQRETLAANYSLMKRYFIVHKAKDADVIGIVVGTLGVGT